MREVSLRVLAPREYFEINNLSWLEKGLDEGVREFALSLINNDIRMSFDFVAFPAEFDVPFSTGAELSAVCNIGEEDSRVQALVSAVSTLERVY